MIAGDLTDDPLSENGGYWTRAGEVNRRGTSATCWGAIQARLEISAVTVT
jgi:hypothetical protein